MGMLIVGILLWSLVHLIPAATPGIKAGWVGRLGVNGYKGSFSLLILLALILIVQGWSVTRPVYLYGLPAGVRVLTTALMFGSLILLVASQQKSAVRQYVRHPMLTGVMLWSVAHLLINGDSRSLILFGGLGVWAALEIVFINRRDPAPKLQKAPGWGQETKVILISIVAFVLLAVVHPYLAGVPVR